MVLERLSWRVTRPNRASFRLLTFASSVSFWTHKEVDLAPQPVVERVLQVGDAVKFHQALGSESLDPYVDFVTAKLPPIFFFGGGGRGC